jgi:hypothetical protein
MNLDPGGAESFFDFSRTNTSNSSGPSSDDSSLSTANPAFIPHPSYGGASSDNPTRLSTPNPAFVTHPTHPSHPYGGPSTNDPRLGALVPNPTFLGASHTNHHYAPPLGSYQPHGPHHEPPYAPYGPIQDPSTMQYFQKLRHEILSQVNEQHYNLKQHTDDVLASVQKTIAELELKVTTLQNQTHTDQPETVKSKKKKDLPTIVKSTLIEAVQRQARALIGVSAVREVTQTGGTSMVLVLPPPHNSPGVEARSSDGHPLFNPDWTQNKNNAYNRRYIIAITQSVLKQAEVSVTSSSMSKSMVYNVNNAG